MRTIVVGIAAPSRRLPLVQLAARLAGGADRPRICAVHVSDEGTTAVRGAGSRGAGSRGAGARIAKELARIAEDVDAAYIVVGATTMQRGARAGPSVARALVRRARCPIAVLPDRARGDLPQPRVVTVAYDASPGAHAALELATELARGTDAQLRLIAVTEPPGSHAGLRHTWCEARRRIRGRQLRRAARDVPADVRVRTELLEGAVDECLLDESRTDADIVLMGSHADGWPHPWRTHASRAARVLERAECAVVVVPSHARHPPPDKPAAAQTARTARPVSRPS